MKDGSGVEDIEERENVVKEMGKDGKGIEVRKDERIGQEQNKKK